MQPLGDQHVVQCCVVRCSEVQGYVMSRYCYRTACNVRCYRSVILRDRVLDRQDYEMWGTKHEAKKRVKNKMLMNITSHAQVHDDTVTHRHAYQPSRFSESSILYPCPYPDRWANWLTECAVVKAWSKCLDHIMLGCIILHHNKLCCNLYNTILGYLWCHAKKY